MGAARLRDRYFECVRLEDILHPRTLFAVGMNREALTPEHGAALRIVIPFKYGYGLCKLITKLTLTDTGCSARRYGRASPSRSSTTSTIPWSPPAAIS